MPRPRRPYDDKEYRENRARLLQSNPVCYWCKKKRATTADHLVEVAEGGTHSLLNLVPACTSCNSSRGGRLGNDRKHNRRKRHRDESWF